MQKRKWFAVLVGVILIILAACTAGYMTLKTLQSSNRSHSQYASNFSNDGESIPIWVPFAIDNSPEQVFEGFLYEGKKVEAASVREAAASGNNVDRITGQIKEKVPHYPFGQILLIGPDMLISADENAVEDDISISIVYYTNSTVDDALAFYRQELGNHERFMEDELVNSTGKTYHMSFSAETEGKFRMDAGVMVMEMPETTGYTCAIYVQAAIRGAAKKEMQEVGIRDDGLPENFPDNIVPIYKMKELYMAEGDSEGCYVQYFSEASYKSIVDFYRTQLNDKTDFNESNDTEGEVWFYCSALGWEINVRIMDIDGYGYAEIDCYVQ